MFFAHLNRAKCAVPLAATAFARDRLHIFYHHIGEWQDRLEVGDHSGFGLPPAARRRRKTLLALVEPLRSTPLAKAPGAAHGPACLDGLFDMSRCLDHEVEHCLDGSDDAEALEL